ncbi:MAG: MBL fold metallo-hydrolase [Kiritimatiellae bacterium]|nr:MBL fold metallo-hydrolase [Kiritimatiellia bacterium]
MSLQVCVLGSGSSGNCTYVASPSTAILVDVGLSGKETEKRLGKINAEISVIKGICISHEHNDHILGLRVFHRRHHIPLYANRGTIDAVMRDPKQSKLEWNVFSTGSSFTIGDIHIDPFSVPHDAYDPVGFIVGTQDAKVGIVTDMGAVTHLIRERLRQCQAIVIEANYDENLLKDVQRPWHLKQRIRGRQGHLSNELAAEVVADIASPHLRQVFLAHLSEECNRQDLALKITENRLIHSGHTHVKVKLSYPDRISEMWSYH